MTFGAALEAIGYRGAEPCGLHPLSAFFELHIEQGPILEAEGKDIGIVTGVQGMRWYEVTVTGASAHTGRRRCGCARMRCSGPRGWSSASMRLRKRTQPAALGAVGLMEVRPNSRNVVPGEVFLLRRSAPSGRAVLRPARAEYTASLREICDPLGLSVSSTRIWDQPPVRFDAACVASVRRAAALSGFSAQEIISGAGHDAAYVSRVAPTAMIFVPAATASATTRRNLPPGTVRGRRAGAAAGGARLRPNLGGTGRAANNLSA
jgi:N-carbamoyl-L-amino-acid hydrolase